jgi:hypothetical protein
MNANKRIYARFTGPEIFLEQGRLLFSLLHTFATAGYRISLFNDLGDKPLEKYGQMVYTIDGLELTDKPPEAPEACYYLYDKADRSLAKLSWQKRVQVRFDLFSPFWFSNPIIMPFPMHPLQCRTGYEQLKVHRAGERKIRIFFSGDTQHYRRVWVRYPRPKLPREQIVNTIRERLGDDLIMVHDATELAGLYQAAYTNKCALTASSEVRIESEDWLATLARADFFLSPPGIVMPMCHNIIEAMAVGAIPITNYPEWLDPPLTHLGNCIAFEDENDLIAKLRLALEMDAEEITRMRKNVLDYYHTHMRSGTLINRIEASPEQQVPILMYTERNVAKHPKQLGRHSILMQGSAIPRENHWFKRILTAYLK